MNNSNNNKIPKANNIITINIFKESKGLFILFNFK